MAEQPKQQAPKLDKPTKPPKRPVEWGLTEADVLEALAGKQVIVGLASGTEIPGALVGYDQFHLTLKVADTVVLIGKGQVETVRRAE